MCQRAAGRWPDPGALRGPRSGLEHDPGETSWAGDSELTSLIFAFLGTGRGALLGQTVGRTGRAVVDWLDDRGPEWKAAAQVVVIDLAACYRTAIRKALPHATIVVDHFHLVRLANQTLTSVRQRVTPLGTRKARARHRLRWANRRRLSRARERLSDRGFVRIGVLPRRPVSWLTAVDVSPARPARYRCVTCTRRAGAPWAALR
ncbi:transposase [Microtetraspora sp. AC03309]|uniref:transposase n=1 Tax=Microtetraspora sp. AC03309 TaxID=2779376 RepID=UPI001E41AE50|nr:transposase [Microtetraspora sp. AC03309]MCC5579042.1 transposase [Microtetraspora sp. AC03309]